jgi:hypothetical protein
VEVAYAVIPLKRVPFIMSAQAMRAILLAIATATTVYGFRDNIPAPRMSYLPAELA